MPRSRGMESKMQYAGTSRDVTTEFSECMTVRDMMIMSVPIIVEIVLVLPTINYDYNWEAHVRLLFFIVIK